MVQHKNNYLKVSIMKQRIQYTCLHIHITAFTDIFTSFYSRAGFEVRGLSSFSWMCGEIVMCLNKNKFEKKSNKKTPWSWCLCAHTHISRVWGKKPLWLCMWDLHIKWALCLGQHQQCHRSNTTTLTLILFWSLLELVL